MPIYKAFMKESSGPRFRSLLLAALVFGSILVTSPIADARQSRSDPTLYYSMEVVPSDQCDVEPIDPEVVRAAAARVYARPPEEPPEVSTVEPPATGIHIVATGRQVRSSSITVYVDGEAFIEEGMPVPDGVPASPFETTDRATVQSIQDFLQLRAACYNTGDPRRTFAQLTPAGIEFAIEDLRRNEFEQSFFENMASLSPASPSNELLLPPVIGDVRVSRDGFAVVYGLFSLTTRNTESDFREQPLETWVLVSVDGEWRIERVLPRIRPVLIAPESERPTNSPDSGSATPTAQVPRHIAPTPVTLLPQAVDPALCQIAPLSLEPTLATVAAIYRDGRTVVEDPKLLLVETETDTNVTIDGEPWVLDGRMMGEASIEPSLEPTLPALTRTLREDAACGNADDFARFFALRTPDGFARLVGDQDPETIDLDDWRACLGQPADPLNEGDRRVEPILLGARSISDGRVALFGVFTLLADDFGNSDALDDTEPDLWIMEQVGDRWLIDWQVDSLRDIPVQLGKAAIATPSTPVAVSCVVGAASSRLRRPGQIAHKRGLDIRTHVLYTDR